MSCPKDSRMYIVNCTVYSIFRHVQWINFCKLSTEVTSISMTVFKEYVSKSCLKYRTLFEELPPPPHIFHIFWRKYIWIGLNDHASRKKAHIRVLLKTQISHGTRGEKAAWTYAQLYRIILTVTHTQLHSYLNITMLFSFISWFVTTTKLENDSFRQGFGSALI